MYSNLNAEMSRREITRAELAKRMNKNPTTISMKLNGKSDISLREAMEIKKVLGVDIPIEELFSNDAEMTA